MHNSDGCRYAVVCRILGYARGCRPVVQLLPLCIDLSYTRETTQRERKVQVPCAPAGLLSSVPNARICTAHRAAAQSEAACSSAGANIGTDLADRKGRPSTIPGGRTTAPLVHSVAQTHWPVTSSNS